MNNGTYDLVVVWLTKSVDLSNASGDRYRDRRSVLILTYASITEDSIYVLLTEVGEWKGLFVNSGTVVD